MEIWPPFNFRAAWVRGGWTRARNYRRTKSPCYEQKVSKWTFKTEFFWCSLDTVLVLFQDYQNYIIYHHVTPPSQGVAIERISI